MCAEYELRAPHDRMKSKNVDSILLVTSLFNFRGHTRTSRSYVSKTKETYLLPQLPNIYSNIERDGRRCSHDKDVCVWDLATLVCF